MNKLFKPASLLMYLLVILVFFMTGMTFAGVSGVAKGQGLGGGAIVFMYGVATATIAFIIALITAQRAKLETIKKINKIFGILLFIAFCLLVHRIYTLKKSEAPAKEYPNKTTKEGKMIDLYYAPTPNGQKVSILLEETRLPYTVKAVDILKGDQFEPEFLKISPNNKIPAIVDHDGPEGKPLALFESGAILMYLAEKTGAFLPKEMEKRYDVIQWLMFQMGSVGPMFGQTHHFFNYAPQEIPYAMNRYRKETQRIYTVMDKRLSANKYLAAGGYSIADMAVYPWVAAHTAQRIDLDDYHNVRKWVNMLKSRKAVQRGFNLMRDQIPDPKTYDDTTKKLLFGIEKEPML